VESPSSRPELAECERCFRAAFAQAAIGISIVDSQGKIVYVNAALCRMSGYEEHELYHMHFTATLHPDDRKSRMEVFRKILAGEIGSFISERRMLCKDGRIAWARTSVTIPAEESEPRQIIVLIEDITEQKLTEDALRASEERFRIAAENGSDLIYEWDLGTGAVGVFGVEQQWMGDWPMPLSYEAWQRILHPADLERLPSELARYIESGEPYQGEYRVIGQKGKIYHYSNRGQAVRNAAGKPYKWVGLCTDITERKLAEEAISRLAAIVECSESAIFATDLAGAILTWNRGAEQLLGYTAGQARNVSLGALFASPALAGEILSEVERGESSRLDDALFVHQNGSQVPVLLTVSPIRQSGGRVSGSAVIVRDISDSKQAEREMEHLALHDPLTGLPNRVLLADRLAASIATADLDVAGTAVIFVDLDGFKFVNDTLGHETGDILLQQVAERLSGCVRRGDLLGRMGGDEFMIVLNDVTQDQDALAIAERMAGALGTPFFVSRRELVITASMGIAIYPRDGTDVSALRRNADAAMYEAKQGGKDRIRFYRPAVSAAFQARLEMESALRHALQRGEFLLHYQPVFTAADHRLVAYEALVRWRHPERGLLSPGEFIALAEETGLIVPLGEWALREACNRCRRWQERGKFRVRVAVNVSQLQFACPDFVETVLEVLRETGLSGHLLDLELTESIVMHDVSGAIEKITQLHQCGVRILVDDFGTGYSSLGYLARLPIDILKIDRCFVAPIGENEDAVRLIQGMISLAHSIGKRVIVEGVETEAQLEVLRSLGCDEVQGFLFGRPMAFAPEDEVSPAGAPALLIA
jgi:diguanylate cyclase (GGDEF)-like protein/PAS domain S-box-containing protein